MILLVCGSRGCTNLALVARELDRITDELEVEMLVNGGARGADKMANTWAHSRAIHTAVVAAMWESHGAHAGPIRNGAMLTLKPDLVVAFWDGQSSGTRNMIEQSRKANVKVEIVSIDVQAQ